MRVTHGSQIAVLAVVAGDVEVVGIEVVGAEVVGAEVVGAEVVGAEVVGTDVKAGCVAPWVDTHGCGVAVQQARRQLAANCAHWSLLAKY